MRTWVARIDWVTGGRKGRSRPPGGQRYVTVARMDDLKSFWPREAWSLVVESDAPLDRASTIEASVRFLAVEAPHHLLRPGATFELFEGAVVTASGTIL